MSKGKAWQIDRKDKQTMRRLEYVACKPLLWAVEVKARQERQESRRLTLAERIRFKHWLYWKYGAECAYCQRVLALEALTIDHIHPKSKGGAVRDIRNMVLACLGCNRDKADTWPYTTDSVKTGIV